MAISLSVADWAYVRKVPDVEAFYEQIMAMGYTGSELTAVANREAARRAGLKLVNRQGPTGWNRVAHHAKGLEEVRAGLADMAAEQIPAMLVFSGNREGQADDVSIAHCIEGLRQAAGLAEEAGKVLLLEVFNSFDHKDYAADSSAFAYEVVRAVASPGLRVLYDIYHMLRMGEEVERTLFDHLEWVGHVHVARSPDRKCAVDEESMRLIERLARSGYAGGLGAEWLADDPVEELRVFADRVRSVM